MSEQVAPGARGPVMMDVTAVELRSLIARLGADVPSGLSNADRIDMIAALEDATAAMNGLQAVLTADLDTATRAEHAAAGVPARRQGAGVATQIGLARRESHTRATRHLGLAKVLTAEMPHTLAAMRAGRLSEWRATIIARETACLTIEDRRTVDAELCTDLPRLAETGDKTLINQARTLAYRLDPHAATARAAHAVTDRYVSCRPAPDTMTWVTALLPVIDGVAVHTTLAAAAQRARCAGDARSTGQVMADELVARITGRPATASVRPPEQSGVGVFATPDAATPDAAASEGAASSVRGGEVAAGSAAEGTSAASFGDAGGAVTRLVVNMVITDAALFGLDDEPAYIHGYGTVPAPWARDRIAEILDRAPTDPHTQAFIRRLYANPHTGALVALESHSRTIRGGLRDLIHLRDRTCRIPYCDAPIAHVDHLVRHSDGGPTTDANTAGLCAAHNLDHEAPGHIHQPAATTLATAEPDSHHDDRRRHRHRFTIITSTGHRYTSTAPALPGAYP